MEGLMHRVELHTHTTHSMDDGLIKIEDLTSFAAKNGMKSVAITDHGSINGFSEAKQVVCKMKKQHQLPDDFKMIYGVEAYLVDDLTGVAMQENGHTAAIRLITILRKSEAIVRILLPSVFMQVQRP